MARSTAARTSGSVKSQAPPKTGFLFATALASFAKVFVGPIPTQVGLPVQRRTGGAQVLHVSPEVAA